MTDPITIDPSTMVDTTPPSPYASQETFTLVAPIQLAQLTDEISTALGTAVTLAVTGPADGDLTMINSSNTAVLSVNPGGVDEATVQGAIDAHVPQDGYDVPEAERQFAAILLKVQADPTAVLDDSEMQYALRGLLARTSTRPNAAGQTAG